MSKNNQTTVCMVRHGQTDWNNLGLIQGLTDNPLNNTGIIQAHEAGKHLKKQKWDIIISSPLCRAQETANIIASHLNYKEPIILADSLVERDFGIADGKHVAEFYELVMKDCVPSMETNEQLMKRVMTGLQNLVTTYPNKKILVVCHSHVIKAALVQISNYQYDFTVKLENTSLNVINYTNGSFNISTYNNKDHIEAISA